MKNLNKQLKALNKNLKTVIDHAVKLQSQRELNNIVVFAQQPSQDSGPGPQIDRGFLDSLEVKNKKKLNVNVEKKVTFTASNPVDGPLAMRTISCEIMDSLTASIADAPENTSPRATASFGKTLTITTNKKGKAKVYVLDGMAEKFKVKGTLTGSVFMPTATTNITVS